MEGQTKLDFTWGVEWDNEPFLIKVGRTTYEVSAHFDPEGRRSILDQFKTLLMQAQAEDIA